MRRWGKRLLLAPALFAGLYLGLYLLPIHLFLGTPLGPRLLNRRPERLRIEWGSAWSLWPGEVEVRQLRITGDNRRASWSVAVDSGKGRIDLPALLRREVRVRRFAGTGVDVRAVRHPPEADSPPPRPGRRRWTIRLEDLRLAGVRALEYGPLRLEGKGKTEGLLRLVLGGETEIRLKSLEMDGGRLLFRDRILARDLTLRAGLRLGPWAPRKDPGAGGFDFLSGTLRASGELDDLPGLRRGARSQGGEGSGRLFLDLRVERGALRPGSRAELAPPVRGSSRMAAVGSVVRGPAGPRLLLEADLAGFAVLRSGGPPLLESAAMRVTAETAELRLSRLLAAARDLRGASGAQAAWVLPGELRARGLRMIFPGRRASLGIAAASGSGQIDLPALLRKEVRIRGLRLEGARLRVGAGRPRQGGPPRNPRGRRWTARLEDVRLAGTCEVQRGKLRLAGDLRAGGNLSWNNGALALDGLSLALSDGRLRREGRDVARDLDLQAALRFGPYAPQRQPGTAWPDLLSGTLQGWGEVIRLPALRQVSATGSGRLAFNLRAERGALLPGSRAELTTAGARGSRTTVTGSVSAGPQLHLDADLRGFAARTMRSDALRVTAVSSEVRLARLFAMVRDLRRPGPAPVGWTLPGDLRAEGLRMIFPGSRSTLEIAVTQGSGRIDLPALLRREVRLDGVKAEGVRLRLTGARARPRRMPARGARGAWTARLADARLAGGYEVALGGYRLAGGLQARGDLSWNGETVALPATALTLSGGRLQRGREMLARDLSLGGEIRLAPFAPGKVQGLEILRLVSGEAKVGGSIASLGFLQTYMEKASWLELDGRGNLQADFRLAAGRLLPGSRFSVRPARIEALYMLSRATGAAELTGAVTAKQGGGELEVRVDLDRFGIAAREPRNARPHLRGQGFRMTLVTQDLDLSRPAKDLRARIDLPEAEVTDLTYYNEYLPRQSGVEILSGTGRLGFWLEMETAGNTGRGEVTLASEAARVRLNDVELAGTLDLRAPLASADLRQPRFGLDGTRLVLDKVALREIGGEEPGGEEPAAEAPPGWWARLELTRVSMDLSRPLSLAGSIRLSMKDSGLLLSLFSRRKRYLKWFQGVLDVEGVEARGNLRLTQGAVLLDPLVATAPGIELRTRLRLSRERTRGYLFVRHKRLAVGIELQDGRRDYQFIRPLQWFESAGEP
ncbi:MAG TPA: hypothetical protein VF756_13770 [Thermoanaerobaculia bacterium]